MAQFWSFGGSDIQISCALLLLRDPKGLLNSSLRKCDCTTCSRRKQKPLRSPNCSHDFICIYIYTCCIYKYWFKSKYMCTYVHTHVCLPQIGHFLSLWRGGHQILLPLKQHHSTHFVLRDHLEAVFIWPGIRHGDASNMTGEAPNGGVFDCQGFQLWL